MKLLGARFTFVAILMGLCAACLSCGDRTGHDGMPTTAKAAKPGPEDSFNLIIETFRRRIEETPVGFVVGNANSRSTMTGTNKVSYELLKPAAESEPYKAVITVTSQSSYYIKRTKEASEDDSSGKDAKEETLSAGKVGPTDADALDPALAGKSPTDAANGASRSGDEVVTRRPDEEVRKYELLYKGGRWELVTELDKETEQSIQNAFNSALKTQM